MKKFITALTLATVWTVQAHAGEKITFNRHVAPILWKHCADCHHPGAVGPFSLLTYKDAAKRARFLKDVTASKRMPPWKAAAGFGDFSHGRGLSESELETLARWADSGAAEGAAANLPRPPSFPESWQLGKPDLIVKMSAAYSVPAGGPDLWRCFVIPMSLDSDKTVAAVEVRPGNRRVVHHVSLFLDDRGQARTKDGKDGKPGYDSFGGPGIVPTGNLGGWTLGGMPRFLPANVGRALKKGSDLVMQVHYHPTGKPETDLSEVGIFFTRKPAQQILTTLVVSRNDLAIPAGAQDYHVVAQSAPLPVDVTALSVAPHMHNLGRNVKVTANLPDSRSVPLVRIDDWDFHWQETYEFAKPMRFPKGTVIRSEVKFDNSSSNPKNPNEPPKLVRWGTNITDEMMVCIVEVIARNPEELRAIEAMRNNSFNLKKK